MSSDVRAAVAAGKGCAHLARSADASDVHHQVVELFVRGWRGHCRRWSKGKMDDSVPHMARQAACLVGGLNQRNPVHLTFASAPFAVDIWSLSTEQVSVQPGNRQRLLGCVGVQMLSACRVQSGQPTGVLRVVAFYPSQRLESPGHRPQRRCRRTSRSHRNRFNVPASPLTRTPPCGHSSVRRCRVLAG
jgi:hypothetical protein